MQHDEDRQSATGRAAALTVAVIAALLYALGVFDGAPRLRLAIKPLPVAAMAWFVRQQVQTPYSRRVHAGLWACALGDVLLELLFPLGMLAFLIGHVFYIAAYLAEDLRPRPLHALPFVAWGLASFYVLRPGLGALTIPVALYTLAICAMMWRAAARVELVSAPPRVWLALVGAVLFAVSDTLIAFNKFHAPVAGARYSIITLYWLGQLGITMSARERATNASARP